MDVKLNRRRFIKGVIASGIAAGAAHHGAAVAGGDRPAQAVDRLLSLNINGRTRRVDVLPQETLANTLRYKLGLTGTKLGCNRGECGACTVLVDDVPPLRLLHAHPQRPRQGGAHRGGPAKRGRHPTSRTAGLCR